MKSNIALIGFMGTGKTTIGKLLAQKLRKEFIEVDAMIERKAGKSIPQIFSENGEITFRELEMSVVKEISSYQNKVISCGGGVVLNKLNIDYLRQSAEIILLQASEEEIMQRCLRDGKEKRPMINKADPINEIKKLLAYRNPLYLSATELRINTTNKSPDEIVNEIIILIRK